MSNGEWFERMQQSINSALDIAKSWEKKKDILWAKRNYFSAAEELLSLAAGKYSDGQNAAQYLHEQSILPVLQKVNQLEASLISEIELGKRDASVLSGNYIPLAFSHLACIMGDFKLSKDFADRAFHQKVVNTSTNFWYDYARGYRCLWEKKPYQKGTFPSLRGSEKYWVPYLELIEAASVGSSLEKPLAAVEESFRQRNIDKSIQDDAYGLSGSPNYPLQWDWRRDGLMKLIEYMRHR